MLKYKREHLLKSTMYIKCVFYADILYLIIYYYYYYYYTLLLPIDVSRIPLKYSCVQLQ